MAGSRACVERECPVERVFDTEHRQTIVMHGVDRWAMSYDDYSHGMILDMTMRRYDQWVDHLHARDDARRANSGA